MDKPGTSVKIYINQCWNTFDCYQIIDSRDNIIQDHDENEQYKGYYLCTECGAGRPPTHYPSYYEKSWDPSQIEKWRYIPGDKCPKCGSPNMERFSKNGEQKTHAHCQDCSHTNRFPKVFLPIIDSWENYKQAKQMDVFI